MATRQSVQQRILSHSVDLFLGGMDSDASPYMLQEGKASLGQNINFYRDNTLRSRMGYLLDTLATVNGQYVTQRISGLVKRVFRQGASYKTETAGTVTTVGAAALEHSFVRVNGGVLAIEPTGIKLLDSDGLNTAAVDTPASLSGVATTGGSLKEGTYTYTYNYLLSGGFESAQAPETTVTVSSPDSKVTLTIPANTVHPKMFRLRIYRQDPGGGFPLFIKELPVGTTSYEDTGDKPSALVPLQGIRAMPGGNLAIVHNRRLFTVDGSVMNYSYPGNYAYSNVFWTEKVNLPTGESIRAICPLGQGLIFFGLETAIFMNGVPAEGGGFNPIPVPDGCVSQSAWTQAEDGTLFYVGKSGVYAMNGASAQRISDPLNDRFRDYTTADLSTATVIYDQQERRLLVSLPNEILVYYFQMQAWSVWDISNTDLDWFEGRIHMHNGTYFGILGEHPSDNGAAITGKFVSGVHGLDDSTLHKLFRRIGLQVSALPGDTVNMTVRALDRNTTYTGLPNRPSSGATWDVSLWDNGRWAGNLDTTQTVSLPDTIQGRYIQFTITFSTTDATNFVIQGPVVIEYRPRYRYGRN